MSKLLFINACPRGKDSRTLFLCHKVLDQIKETNCDIEIEEIKLYKEKLSLLDHQQVQKRDDLLMNQQFDDPMFDYANQLAQADIVVIGAPYWDLSFPAALKIYLEQTSVVGITFKYEEDGHPKGLCKAHELYYVTTSGGYIGEYNFGFNYVEAIGQLYGIAHSHFISAEGLDIVEMDEEKILLEAIENLK